MLILPLNSSFVAYIYADLYNLYLEGTEQKHYVKLWIILKVRRDAAGRRGDI